VINRAAGHNGLARAGEVPSCGLRTYAPDIETIDSELRLVAALRRAEQDSQVKVP
jgi:hypothetical protein